MDINMDARKQFTKILALRGMQKYTDVDMQDSKSLNQLSCTTFQNAS